MHDGGTPRTGPTPTDPNHLLLIKLAEVPKSVQPLMMVIARDSLASTDTDGNLLINTHFEVVQGALIRAQAAHRRDLVIAVSLLSVVAAITAVVVLLMR